MEKNAHFMIMQDPVKDKRQPVKVIYWDTVFFSKDSYKLCTVVYFDYAVQVSGLFTQLKIKSRIVDLVKMKRIKRKNFGTGT